MQKRRAWWIAAVPAAAVVTAVAVPLSAGAAPDLPDRSAAQVLALIASGNDAVYSGTLEQTSDLGLPEIPSTGGSAAAGGDGVSQALELLASSHEARVFVGGDDLQRIQVLDRLAERDVIRNGDDVWLYDSSAAEATHGVLPTGEKQAPQTTLTPAEIADELLAGIDDSTTVTVEDDARVAGRDAYVITLTPDSDDTLVGSATLSVDGETGLPLAARVYARGQEAPAFSVEFSDIDFSAPDADLFEFVPPADATVTEVQAPTGSAWDGTMGTGARPDATVTGEGWSTIVSLDLPGSGATASTGDSAEAAQLLDEVTTPVDGGRALQTALLSVLLTDDGRVLIGAVPTDALAAAAGL